MKPVQHPAAAVIALLASFALSWAQSPVGESTVVGGVLIDLFGSYWFYRQPVQSDLPIRVAVEYFTADAKPKMYTYKLKTDANGYFKIENAPAGSYILKAIELNVGQSTNITVASKYGQWAKGTQYRYWGVLSGMMYRNERHLIETIFENKSDSGLIDMGITHLSIKIDERLGGSAFKNYSPNGMPPWIRMSLIQGAGRLADFTVVDDTTRADIVDVKMQEKDVTINMISASDYFGR
ncbi:hypothetical protein JW998_09265 [candidate division KSB1 bacterium]|nr:hypothetical protein [candidate division KSB1 bacterium]